MQQQHHPGEIRVWSGKDLRFLYSPFKAKWLLQANITVYHVILMYVLHVVYNTFTVI